MKELCKFCGNIDVNPNGGLVVKQKAFGGNCRYKNPGTVTIPDRSNGPKTIKQPDGCHCHCISIITNAWYENGKLKFQLNGGQEHTHPGKGGWWKNDDCNICKN